jgi:DNA-binding NarL/FixJ family response regulator
MSEVVQEPIANASASERRRLLLIGRPGLFNECLCRMFTERGFETVLQPIADQISRATFTPELAVFCISQLDPELILRSRQRIEELHALVPELPVVMLFEEAARTELRDIAQLDVNATIVGVNSINVAIAAIQFVLANGPERTVEIRLDQRALGEGGEAGAGTKHGFEDASLRHDSRFTEREAAVLERLRQGQPNKIIAHALGVSESTVKVHLRSIMSKLKVSNRTQIVCTLAKPSPLSVTVPVEMHAALPQIDHVPSSLVDPSGQRTGSLMSEVPN